MPRYKLHARYMRCNSTGKLEYAIICFIYQSVAKRLS